MKKWMILKESSHSKIQFWFRFRLKLLIKRASKPIENEAKEQKFGQLPLVPGILGAPLVSNIFSGLTEKDTVLSCPGNNQSSWRNKLTFSIKRTLICEFFVTNTWHSCVMLDRLASKVLDNFWSCGCCADSHNCELIIVVLLYQ